MHIIKPLVGGGSFYPSNINHSCMFPGGADVYLQEPDSGTPDSTTATLVFSMKRSSLADAQFLTCAYNNINYRDQLFLDANDQLNIAGISNGAFYYQITPTMRLRDVSSWYHFMVHFDRNNAVAADRIRVWANGLEVTDFSIATYPTQYPGGYYNQAAYPWYIGLYPGGAGYDFNGYMANVIKVDGALRPVTDFGKFKDGIWVPARYTGPYGARGFHLDFNTAANLGDDTSPGARDFTVVGLDATNQTSDTPTNNAPTFNAIQQARNAVLTEGNLIATTAGATTRHIRSTMSLPVGNRWYWEYLCNAGDTYHMFGIIGSLQDAIADGWSQSNSVWYYAANGSKYVSGTGSAYGAAFTAGDVIGVAVDLISDTIQFYKNNVAQGSIPLPALLPGEEWFPAFSDGSSTLYSSATVNFGQRALTYTPPTGFKLLCSKNLPEPEIIDGSGGMGVALWTGEGTTPRPIPTLSFSPDITWVKDRSVARDHWLFDSLRGQYRYLTPNSSEVEIVNVQSILSFDTNGFTIGSAVNVNATGELFAAWNWRTGAQYGVDVAAYTGDGVAGRTVNHALAAKPELIIGKRRALTPGSWLVYHHHVLTMTDPETDYGVLDTNVAWVDQNTVWNDTAPTASNFTVGSADSINGNGSTFIAYLFKSVPGFSKVFSYEGNSIADGPFVWLGFKPQFLLIKNAEAIYSWCIYDSTRDTYNPVTKALYPDLPNVEGVGPDVDFLSSGFKVRTTNAQLNQTGNTYIGVAFAANPFKYANAR